MREKHREATQRDGHNVCVCLLVHVCLYVCIHVCMDVYVCMCELLAADAAIAYTNILHKCV